MYELLQTYKYFKNDIIKKFFSKFKFINILLSVFYNSIQKKKILEIVFYYNKI